MRRWALPLVVLSAISGVAGLGLLKRRRYVAAWGAAALAVAAILWTWGAAQYPAMLVGSLTVDQAASQPAVPCARLLGPGLRRSAAYPGPVAAVRDLPAGTHR
ncbi:cytochrome d ubiquinol oxidase subunit II [Streptomyces sp. NPDC001604]|uniref:cytochrome d ubiquinol oxidase subunit II n=1 Tax=Streptomyces sp. NPDC001604 TaxID=3364593 RepID=UPI0036BA594A